MATLVVTINTEAHSETLEKDARFSPVTADITAMALYDVERQESVLYTSNQTEGASDDYLIKRRTEKEMLEDFWEGAAAYDTFVTFNGRSYTLPFLYHKAVQHKIVPSVRIAPQRYLTKQTLPYHIDLLDELTFYGGMRKHKLTDFCQLLLPGMNVPEQSPIEFELQAIAKLYDIWLKNFAPSTYLNKLEF